MIRTFGLGPWVKNGRLLGVWVRTFGSKIVGKSQGKRKNNALGKMANFGPFFRSLDGLFVPKKETMF